MSQSQLWAGALACVCLGVVVQKVMSGGDPFWTGALAGIGLANWIWFRYGDEVE